ncbi:MAG: DEAD/DEAH box helicase [Herpetosiphon sp.]
MGTFAELGLSEPLLKMIAELGYEEPTPIQERTIKRVTEGGDIIAQAQTGTGKTAAFALPIIDRLDPQTATPQALVLTPTRELAMQVAEAFHSYGKYRGVSVLPVYGGQPIGRQLAALQRGVHIVVGTPGRLLDHIQRGTLHLQHVRTVVLDEADEMLDMGFIEDIEAILQQTPEDRQTLLFSATIPNQIATLSKRYLRNPERISVTAEKVDVPLIRQVYYDVGGRDKFEILCRILDFETPVSSIIFCRTKGAVDDLGQRLSARAYPAETLHGDLSQIQRDRVMGRFRSNQVEVLVATDVAARGLDIEHVSHVINFDIPLDPESYVHRIGRTGRAGRSGVAITLVTPRERRLLRTIEAMVGHEIQRLRLPTIADVIARRREAFKESLRETMASGGLEKYTILVEELGEEYNPGDLAAAAFKLLLDEPEIPAEDPLAVHETPEQRSPRTNRGEPTDGFDRSPGRGRFGPERGMARLYLDIGREDNIRPADIVGAIANEAGIPGRAIGSIDLYDRFTFVEVPEQTIDRVMKALKRTTIRGRKISPTIARPQTPQR